MRRSRERGLTFVTVLMLLALAAGIYWVAVFGQIYWDNQEVKSLLRQAANSAYQQKDDKYVRIYLLRSLDDKFGYDGDDGNGHAVRRSRLEYEPDDLKLERTLVPPLIRIDMHYTRTFVLPIFGGLRVVSFNDHVEQDLSVVKW